MIGWALRQIALWVMVAIVTAGIFSHRDQIFAWWRAHAEHRSTATTEGSAASGGDRRMTFRAGDHGHFFVDAEVEGTPVRFMVDTGASHVALTAEDAQRIGIRLSERDFTVSMATANGIARAAPVILREVSIGPLRVRNVQGSVTANLAGYSLLGMSFLSRLDGYQVRGDRLVLFW